jgi:ribosomal protein L12E/L44/L45/RPP1/RPP2
MLTLCEKIECIDIASTCNPSTRFSAKSPTLSSHAPHIAIMVLSKRAKVTLIVPPMPLQTKDASRVLQLLSDPSGPSLASGIDKEDEESEEDDDDDEAANQQEEEEEEEEDTDSDDKNNTVEGKGKWHLESTAVKRKHNSHTGRKKGLFLSFQIYS